MPINQPVRGVKAVVAYLERLPRGVKRVGLRALTEYLIGNASHGLKHYSPYKYVSRKRAYGYTFKSDKQRRYVMAAIREGKIDPGTPHRTGKGSAGWTMAETQRGFTIKNPEESMKYSMSDQYQANLNALAGWRAVSQNISDNIKGAVRHAGAAIKKFLVDNKKG